MDNNAKSKDAFSKGQQQQYTPPPRVVAKNHEQWSLARVFSGETSTTVASMSWEDDDDYIYQDDDDDDDDHHHSRPMTTRLPPPLLPTLLEHPNDNNIRRDDSSHHRVDDGLDDEGSHANIHVAKATTTLEPDPNNTLDGQAVPVPLPLQQEQEETQAAKPAPHMTTPTTTSGSLKLDPKSCSGDSVPAPFPQEQGHQHDYYKKNKTVIETGGPIAVVAWNRDHEPDGLVVWMDTATNKTVKKEEEESAAPAVGANIDPDQDVEVGRHASNNFMDREARDDKNKLPFGQAPSTVASWETIELTSDVDQEETEELTRHDKDGRDDDDQDHARLSDNRATRREDGSDDDEDDIATPATTTDHHLYNDDPLLSFLSLQQQDDTIYDTDHDSGVATATRSNLPTLESLPVQEESTVLRSVDGRSHDRQDIATDRNRIHRLRIVPQDNTVDGIVDRVPTTDEYHVWLTRNSHITDAPSDVAVAPPKTTVSFSTDDNNDEEAQLISPSTNMKRELRQHATLTAGDSKLRIVPTVEESQAGSDVASGGGGEVSHRHHGQDSNTKTKTKPNCVFSCFCFIMGLYEILGVLIDVITDIAFFIDLNRVHPNWQGLKVVLMASILLPGTALTTLWMRHQFPHGKFSGTMAIPSQIFYWGWIVLSSFVFSWPLFVVFLVADLLAVLLGPEVYFCLLRMAPEDFLQLRRLVYSLCEDPTQLLVQAYVIFSGRIHGATLVFAMVFTLLNLAKTTHTLWKRTHDFQGTDVSLLLYVRSILGAVPKDARFSAAYAEMLRRGHFPYEHIILNYAGLDDSDAINLIDALVEASVNQKQLCSKLPSTLQLRGNKLTDLSVFHMSSQLKRLPSLQVMDIAKNCFGDLGSEGLAEYIQSSDCTNLRVLIIEGNEHITREGYHSLARAIRYAFKYQKLQLEILVMDHKGGTTELLREACTHCNVDTFSPIMEPAGRRNQADVDSDATVVGSVRLASRYFFFGRRRA